MSNTGSFTITQHCLVRQRADMEVIGDEAISGPILVFMLRHGLEVSYNSSNGWLVPVLGGY